jgi:Spy/CpxP family protein refolding chaperone
MKTVRILALILAVGVAIPALGWAQVRPPASPPSQERPMKRELPPEAKELLERQREEMKALREKYRAEMQTLQQKHRAEQRALMEKLRQERGPVGPPEKKSP